jgi:hypothetical protein
MTVRYLAQELYRLTQRVEELEAALAAMEEGTPLAARARLETELLQARKERDHFRAVLEAKKENFLKEKFIKLKSSRFQRSLKNYPPLASSAHLSFYFYTELRPIDIFLPPCGTGVRPCGAGQSLRPQKSFERNLLLLQNQLP